MARNDADFVPGLIVFGLDDAGKPHASVFATGDAEAAKAAAMAMAMRSLPVTAGDHAALVKALPEGRVFASGSCFVPFVKADLYEQLTALAGPPAPGEASGKGKQADSTQNAPAASLGAKAGMSRAGPAGAGAGDGPTADPADLWAGIEVGQLVLGYDADAEAYFPAWVTKVRAKGVLTIQWRDYLGEKPIDQHIKDIGLIHPARAKNRRT
jgi:hypothetical protein